MLDIGASIVDEGGTALHPQPQNDQITSL